MDVCAIYVRLSNEDRNKVGIEDSESIINQRNMLVDYARKQKWEIYDIYSDDDYSGGNEERPAFNQLIDDAKNGCFNIILCKSQSRFVRNMESLAKYLHRLFLEWQIRFVSVVDNIDTKNIQTRKTSQISGLVDEWFLEDQSENVKSALKVMRDKGEYVASFACYGYQKDPNDKHKLIIDEKATDVVRRIFDMFINGNGYKTIANILNSEGIPCPSQYKKENGCHYVNPNLKQKVIWKPSTIRSILKKEIYTGTMVQGMRRKVSYKTKEVVLNKKEDWSIVPHTHPAIISYDTFLQAQSKFTKRKQGISASHMLANKVFCIECGYAMMRVKRKNEIYLICKMHEQHATLCKCKPIKYENLTSQILNEMKIHFKKYVDLYEVNGMVTSEVINENKKRVAALNEKIIALKKQKKNIYMNKVNGKITDEQFSKQSNVLNQDIANFENQLSQYKDYCELEEDVNQEMIDLLNSKELTPELVNQFIDKVEISNEYIDKNRKIRIFWKC